MDKTLKALIAAACIVVIAGGGYFAWSEYRTRQMTAARNSAIAAATLERVRRDNLTEASCSILATSALSKVTGEQFRTPERMADLRTCFQMDLLGYVERRDLVASGLFSGS